MILFISIWFFFFSTWEILSLVPMAFSPQKEMANTETRIILVKMMICLDLDDLVEIQWAVTPLRFSLVGDFTVVWWPFRVGLIISLVVHCGWDSKSFGSKLIIGSKLIMLIN